ncbi:MAG: hypothetical protein BMS9Abin17_1044 [Acidimicrobiia bacterium]|nr:MAG: hypothetical protein BMS9Abin17_1044 [Acidimicrobiia bacterium]
MRKYLLIFALLAVTLAACRVESNVILDIREDGSASVGTEVGFDDEFRNIIEGLGAVPEDMLSELPSFGGDDVVLIQRTEDDLTFFGAMSEIEDLSSYDFEGAGEDTFASFSYEFDGSSARLNATVKADGLVGAAGEDLPIDPSQITADLVSANVMVTMPGRVKEHNADEVRSDGTLVWNVSLTGATSISATSELGSSTGSLMWWIIGGILVLAVAGGVTAAFGTRKKKEEKAVAAAAAAHEAGLEDLDDEAPATDQPDTT